MGVHATRCFLCSSQRFLRHQSLTSHNSLCILPKRQNRAVIWRHWPTNANPSGRAVSGVRLRPLASWDCGFESHAGALVSVSCEFCLLSDRGTCVGVITRPEESCWVWCVSECGRETSIVGGPGPLWGPVAPWKKRIYERNRKPSKSGHIFPWYIRYSIIILKIKYPDIYWQFKLCVRIPSVPVCSKPYRVLCVLKDIYEKDSHQAATNRKDLQEERNVCS